VGFFDPVKDVLGSLKVGTADGGLKISAKLDHLSPEAVAAMPHLEIRSSVREDRCMTITVRDPGGDGTQVRVAVDGDALSVSREADQEKDARGVLGEAKVAAHIKETQRIKIPQGYDLSKMTTSVVSGVLMVVIPPGA
jgi:hypothetical protein